MVRKLNSTQSVKGFRERNKEDGNGRTGAEEGRKGVCTSSWSSSKPLSAMTIPRLAQRCLSSLTQQERPLVDSFFNKTQRVR